MGMEIHKDSQRLCSLPSCKWKKGTLCSWGRRRRTRIMTAWVKVKIAMNSLSFLLSRISWCHCEKGQMSPCRKHHPFHAQAWGVSQRFKSTLGTSMMHRWYQGNEMKTRSSKMKSQRQHSRCFSTWRAKLTNPSSLRMFPRVWEARLQRLRKARILSPSKTKSENAKQNLRASIELNSNRWFRNLTLDWIWSLWSLVRDLEANLIKPRSNS